MLPEQLFFRALGLVTPWMADQMALRRPVPGSIGFSPGTMIQ